MSIPIDLKNCTLFVIDGTGANFIGIRTGDGNFTYSVKKTKELKKSRGLLNTVREGEELPCDISFQFVWDFITSSGSEPPTIEEALGGLAPGWTSASDDVDAPFAVNLQIVNNVTCSRPTGIQEVETHNFLEFHYTELNHSPKDGVVDCKGFSNRVEPTIVRS